MLFAIVSELSYHHGFHFTLIAFATRAFILLCCSHCRNEPERWQESPGSVEGVRVRPSSWARNRKKPFCTLESKKWKLGAEFVGWLIACYWVRCSKGLFRLEHLEPESAVRPLTILRVPVSFMGLQGPCVHLRRCVSARRQVLGRVCKKRPGFPGYDVVFLPPLPLSFVFSLTSTLFLKSFPLIPICT